MRMTGIRLSFRDAAPFGAVAQYRYFWAHGAKRQGAAGILKDRTIRPNAWGNRFPSFGFCGFGAQGRLNPDNAHDLLRKLYKAVLRWKTHLGRLTHSGGVLEVQQLCRHHHRAVAATTGTFHAAHIPIREIGATSLTVILTSVPSASGRAVSLLPFHRHNNDESTEQSFPCVTSSFHRHFVRVGPPP